MDSLHPFVGLGATLIAAAAGVLVLINAPMSWLGQSAERRSAPPQWILVTGVVVTAVALGVVIWRALGRGDSQTAIFAALAMAANHSWLALAASVRSARIAMAGLFVFTALVLATVGSANAGRVTVAAALVCAVWAAINLTWTGRLAYARAASDPNRRAYRPRHA